MIAVVEDENELCESLKMLLTVRRTKTNDEYDLLPACCV